MSDDVRRITCAWESPRNEGTASYRVGQKIFDYSVSWSREHGASGGYPVKFTVGSILREEYDEGFRIEVLDENGVTRVNLPAASCAWEVSDE